MTIAPSHLQGIDVAARRATAVLPRQLTFGSRSATRAEIVAAAARDSAALQRIALDVPAGVGLERVLQK